MMKGKCLWNKVIIKRDDAQKESAGGILLPDQAQGKPQKGVVLMTGPGKHRNVDGTTTFVPCAVKEGDHVLFGKWSGAEIEDDERNEYVICTDEDIMFVFEPEKKR